MERLEGMISDIVFKNEENGYTIAHLANSMDDIVIVGCMTTLSVSPHDFHVSMSFFPA